MKYIYFSLYQFYTKVLWNENYYPDTSAVIALLETFLIFTIINICIYYNTGEQLLMYSPLIPTVVYSVLYYINYQYFKVLEGDILKELGTYPQSQKLLMYIFTLILVVLIVWGYLFDGFYQLLWDTRSGR